MTGAQVHERKKESKNEADLRHFFSQSIHVLVHHTCIGEFVKGLGEQNTKQFLGRQLFYLLKLFLQEIPMNDFMQVFWYK